MIDIAKLNEDLREPATLFLNSVAQRKTEFTDRTSFNLWICDELSNLGIGPNSANVLEIGRWGSAGSVAADVRNWHAALPSRLANHALIPAGVRLQANQIFEKMWSIAKEENEAPLAALTLEHTDLATALNDSKVELDAVKESLTELSAALATEKQAALAALEQHKQASDAHKETISALHTSIAAAALTHKEQLAQTALAHKDALAEVEQKAQSHLGVIARQYHSELEAKQALVESAQAGEVKALRESALQIDAARLDVRKATARTDAAEAKLDLARAEIQGLREKLAAAEVQAAKAAAAAAGELAMAKQSLANQESANLLLEKNIQELAGKQESLEAEIKSTASKPKTPS